MRIKEIYIEDFLIKGRKTKVKFDKVDGKPSFITGPNGYGKTIILDIMYNILTKGTIPDKYTDLCSYVKITLIETFPFNKKIEVEWRPNTKVDVKSLGLGNLIRMYRTETDTIQDWSKLFSKVCKYSFLPSAPEKLYNNTLVNLINREAFYIMEDDTEKVLGPNLRVINDELVVYAGDSLVKDRTFLGDGTMKLLNLLVNLYLLPENGILLIDEIERGLHLATNMEMLNMIKDLVPVNSQVISTTHSPTVFDGDFKMTSDLYRIDKEIKNKDKKS